jgi:membrane protease YdiL (CAAX protease family)
MTTPPATPNPDGELLPPSPLSLETPPALAPKDPPWTVFHVFLLFGVALSIVVIVQVIAVAVGMRLIPGASPFSIAKNARVLIPAQFVSYILILLVMVVWLRSMGVRFWNGIHWNWPQRWPVLILFGIGLSVLVQLAGVLLPIPKQLPIEEFSRETIVVYLLAIFGITLAPLMEELLFRGFLYPALAHKMRFVLAVLLTSALFTLIHAPQLARAWAPLLILFVVAIVLTLVRARTNSVAASVLVHVGYNFGLFSVMWFVTDHFRNLENASR